MLRKAKEFLAKIRKELKDRKMAHSIIKENGITLTYDYDKEKFGYVPGSTSIKNYYRYPIKFLEDDRTMPADKLMQFILSKIEEGLDDFVISIIKHDTVHKITKKAGEARAKSRFFGKSKEEISEIMKKVRRGHSE